MKGSYPVLPVPYTPLLIHAPPSSLFLPSPSLAQVSDTQHSTHYIFIIKINIQCQIGAMQAALRSIIFLCLEYGSSFGFLLWKARVNGGRKKIWVWSESYYLWPKTIIKLTELKQNNNKKQVHCDFQLSCKSSCLADLE